MKLKESVIGNNHLFLALESLVELVQPTPKAQFLRSHELSDETFMAIEGLFEAIGVNLKIEKDTKGTECLFPLRVIPVVKTEFTFIEWMAMQAYFPQMDKFNEHHFHRKLMEKLAKIDSKNKDLDLYSYLESVEPPRLREKRLDNDFDQIIEVIQSSLLEGEKIIITLGDGGESQIYGHRLIFLEGKLSLVGEDISDRALVSFILDEVTNIEKKKMSKYIPNYSPLEVNDFIYAIRAVAGSAQRLVLKIPHNSKINLTPGHHFMGNPFLTQGLEGDKIWAASVEVSDELFHWLYLMRGEFEILDPLILREDYEAYEAFLDKKKKCAS